MKVKCKNIYNEHIKEYQDSSPWLTIGKEYIVLEIMISVGRDLSYRLVGDNDDGSPSIFIASQFEIVSDLIPSNWNTEIVNNSLIVIGPKAWFCQGFWESCYDGDPVSLEIYKREARIILDEEG